MLSCSQNDHSCHIRKKYHWGLLVQEQLSTKSYWSVITHSIWLVPIYDLLKTEALMTSPLKNVSSLLHSMLPCCSPEYFEWNMRRMYNEPIMRDQATFKIPSTQSNLDFAQLLELVHSIYDLPIKTKLVLIYK